MSSKHVVQRDMQAGDSEVEYTISVLDAFLRTLDASDVEYALIHHRRDDLATDVRSDIDIAFDRNPQEIVPRIIDQISRDWDLQLIHCLHYEIPRGYYYMLRVGSGCPEFLHLDCLYDPIGVNRYILPTRYFLSDAIREDGIRHASVTSEAVYLLIKRAIKGGMSSLRLEAIKQRVSEAGPGMWSKVDELFGPGARNIVHELLQVSSAELAEPLLNDLRKRVTARYRRRHPILFVTARLLSLGRKIGRFFRPTGYFVVLLGPDGSGKSTVSNLVLEQLERAFRKTWRFHWRPGLLPKLGRGSTPVNSGCVVDNAPASESKYRGIVSMARYIYYWLDFVVGYWLVIYPRKAQTTLVLGERYFPDVLVHPERYGFAVPRWFMRITSLLVPSPDLVILLTDDPVVIYTRKPELSVEAIAHQIAEYRMEMRHWGESAEILTQGGAENVAFRIGELILLGCEERAANQMGFSDMRKRWAAFPPTRSPKLWINESDDIGNALNLYHPYSSQGKIIKTLLSGAPAWLNRLYPRRRPALQVQYELKRMAGAIRAGLELPDAAVSFSRGTPGAHQKMTAQVSDGGSIVSYVKISEKPDIKKMLRRERDMLDYLAEYNFEGAVIPHVQECLESGNALLLFLSSPESAASELDLSISVKEIQFLTALAMLSTGTSDIDMYLDRKGIASLIERYLVLDPESAALVQGVVTAVKHLVTVTECVSHGDYAPWNALILSNGNLYVFDWEYADTSRCALWDAFHRIFMPGWLVLKTDPGELIDKLANLHKEPGLSAVVNQQGLCEERVPFYLLLYLLELAERLFEGKGLDDFMKASLQRALNRAGSL